MKRCPRCDSPSPELHPAVQFEGEVQECGYAEYHEPATAQALARVSRSQDARSAERDKEIMDRTNGWGYDRNDPENF